MVAGLRRNLSYFYKVSVYRRKSDGTQVFGLIGITVLYMKTAVYLWLYLTQLFLELETFQTNFVYKIKTYILFSITFLSKIVPFIR